MESQELWETLEKDGLDEVRRKRAEGVYGARKLPLVDEWVHQKESKGGLVVPADAQREMLFNELKSMNRPDFIDRIRQEKDDGRLGYLRYDFDWNPDPRKSTWQAIEINRLLTKRKESRSLRPAWVGIIFAALLSLASLIVSIIGLLKKT